MTRTSRTPRTRRAPIDFGAIIIAPICYAILGFIGGLIGAVVYNFAAGMMGGIEVETA